MMNREIKFRAWDKKRKIIVDVENIGKNAIGYKFNTRKGNITTTHYKSKSRGYFNLMQYTGLKDKNGKEIYEGDIVICRAGETYQGRSEHEATVTVEFGFTQAMWEMLQYDTLEIIGNIHEGVQE